MNSDTNAKLASDVESYAERAGAVEIIEDLTKVLICERPAKPLEHLAGHLELGRAAELPSEAGACGTEADATDYLAAHQLPQTLEELLGMMLFNQPEDPRAFLAAELRKLQAASSTRKDGFFTDDDLEGMFSLFDPTGKGFITQEQAAAGAQSLGLDAPEPPAGSGAEGGLTMAEFQAWVRPLLDSSRVL